MKSSDRDAADELAKRIESAFDGCKLWPEQGWPAGLVDTKYMALLEIRNAVPEIIAKLSELATLRRRVDAAGALLGKWLRTGRDLPGLVICEEIRRVLSPPAQPRDESTGQYGFDGDFSRVCVCGHPLGVHTAAAPHECMNGDRGCPGANGDACDCRGFKLPRRHKARASLSPPTRKE